MDAIRYLRANGILGKRQGDIALEGGEWYHIRKINRGSGLCVPERVLVLHSDSDEYAGDIMAMAYELTQALDLGSDRIEDVRRALKYAISHEANSQGVREMELQEREASRSSA